MSGLELALLIILGGIALVCVGTLLAMASPVVLIVGGIVIVIWVTWAGLVWISGAL